MTAKTRRIITLVAPSLIAALAASHGTDPLLHVVAPAIVLMWTVMAGALVMRFNEAPRQRTIDDPSPWDQLDILTPTGTAVMWTAASAFVAAKAFGWASLAVIGLLGFSTVYIAVTWSAIVAGGGKPWRRATVRRTIFPETAVEGDLLREEVRLTNVTIPPGMRLFAIGRAMRHGALSRYFVGSEGSGADIKLESELGPAMRGEYRVPPLALWLGDVLGLTHTPAAYHGGTQFTVLPRPGAVDGVRVLLGNGGDDATSRPAHQLPTEGSFRIREYVPGDDMRRIHWVRSLQQNELVVRLPDELPPAEPVVRLVLDTELYGAESLTCRAMDDLLDALVRVWLGIGKALSEGGTRVTLVTAADKQGRIARVEKALVARSSREPLKLGARVAWQSIIPLPMLIDRSTTRTIVVSSRPRRLKTAPDVSWVVVPELAWTSEEPPLPGKALVRLPFPSGSPDNRSSHRMHERRRIEMMWQDRALFSQVVCWTDFGSFSGDYVARPTAGRIGLTVIP